MFSVKEKQHIAAVVEKTVLDLKHPEMPTEKPVFKLHINGKEDWSWADIEPNWTYGVENPPGVNPWNEVAREEMKSADWYEKQIKGLVLVLDEPGRETFITKEYVLEKLHALLSGGINFHPNIKRSVGIEDEGASNEN